MEERPFHPLDYVSVLRRRKWWFIVPLVVCTLGGALLALILPKEYKSVAEIGIAAPTLSPDLLRGVSSGDLDERRRAISQLLSPTVLERVVREERINPSAPVPATAAWLRRKVEPYIDVPKPIGRSDGSKPALDRFTLGYIDSSPERAQRIANRLATVFVEENSKQRTERAENTAAVLEQQMRASHERLAVLQERLRQQKEANIGRLPSQENANLQAVNGWNSRIENLSMQLAMEQNRLTMLDQQLDEMRRSAPRVPPNPASSPLAAQLYAAQSRITTLSQELARTRALGYTDEHPEIRRMNRELDAARADLAAARKADAGGTRDELLAADPLYNERTLDRKLTQNRIRELQQSIRNANAQIAMYQNRLESVPLVEQALFSLQQEHEMEKKRYEELSGKHARAVMEEELARKQGIERFSVLYPASRPGTPEKPDVVRLMLMSIALGFALGALLVVGREFMDRSVHDARALQSEFEIPVLGEIPRIPKVA